MAWLERINGGRPLQAGDYAVLAFYLATYLAAMTLGFTTWSKSREK